MKENRRKKGVRN